MRPPVSTPMASFLGKCPSCGISLHETLKCIQVHARSKAPPLSSPIPKRGPQKHDSAKSSTRSEFSFKENGQKTQTKFSLLRDFLQDTREGPIAPRVVSLYGSHSTLFLTQKLCVELYSPDAATNVVVVDGGNVFDLYLLTCLAQSEKINPNKLLKRIQISRAFTCYQLASLVLEKLPAALDEFHAKSVVILNIADLFLDPDVPLTEARLIFQEISRRLQLLSKRQHVLVIASNPVKPKSAYFSTQLSLQRLLSSYSDDLVRVSETDSSIILTREKGFRSVERNKISLNRDYLTTARSGTFLNPMAILPNNLSSLRVR